MSISSEINQDLNTIIRTVTGELTLVDLKESLSASLVHPSFKVNMDVIWDLTDAELSNLSVDEIFAAIKYLHNHIEDRGSDYKLVVVAPVDLSFGMARMFQSYAQDISVSIKILRKLDDAYSWINDA